MAKTISDAVTAAFRNLLDETIQNQVEDSQIRGYLGREIEQQISYLIRQSVKQRIETELTETINQINWKKEVLKILSERFDIELMSTEDAVY